MNPLKKVFLTRERNLSDISDDDWFVAIDSPRVVVFEDEYPEFMAEVAANIFKDVRPLTVVVRPEVESLDMLIQPSLTHGKGDVLAVLTDLMLPHKEMECEYAGLHALLDCRKKRLPVVMVTSGYHHEDFESLWRLMRGFNIHGWVVDSVDKTNIGNASSPTLIESAQAGLTRSSQYAEELEAYRKKRMEALADEIVLEDVSAGDFFDIEV